MRGRRCAHRITRPPGQPKPAELVPGFSAPQAQRQVANRGRHCRAHDCGKDDKLEQVGCPVERISGLDKSPYQIDGGNGFQTVPYRDGDRVRHRHIREQNIRGDRSQENAGSCSITEPQDRSDRHSRWRPNGRYTLIKKSQRQPNLCRHKIEGRNAQNFNGRLPAQKSLLLFHSSSSLKTSTYPFRSFTSNSERPYGCFRSGFFNSSRSFTVSCNSVRPLIRR